MICVSGETSLHCKCFAASSRFWRIMSTFTNKTRNTIQEVYEVSTPNNSLGTCAEFLRSPAAANIVYLLLYYIKNTCRSASETKLIIFITPEKEMQGNFAQGTLCLSDLILHVDYFPLFFCIATVGSALLCRQRSLYQHKNKELFSRLLSKHRVQSDLYYLFMLA